MTFEMFERPGRTPDEPTLSITAAGNLHLNRAARDLLAGATKVELLFDREHHIIGVRPSARPEDSPVVFNLRTTRDGGGATIHAQTFVDHYGLRGDETRRRPTKFDDGIVMADVSGVPA